MEDRERRSGLARPLASRPGAAVLLALFALLVASVVTAQSRPDDPGLVRLDAPMPPLGGPTLRGGRFGRADYAGKVVLLNFWASWCAPCRREQPALEALWRRLRASADVAFVGVDHLDRRPKALSWIERYGVSYPSIWDPEGELATRFGVPYLPTTILTDASGRMRYRLIGEQEAETLERLIDELRQDARER